MGQWRSSLSSCPPSQSVVLISPCLQSSARCMQNAQSWSRRFASLECIWPRRIGSVGSNTTALCAAQHVTTWTWHDFATQHRTRNCKSCFSETKMMSTIGYYRSCLAPGPHVWHRCHSLKKALWTSDGLHIAPVSAPHSQRRLGSPGCPGELCNPCLPCDHICHETFDVSSMMSFSFRCLGLPLNSKQFAGSW